MNTLLALVIVGFGFLAGFVSAWDDSTAMRIGMAALGLLVAMPVAAAVLAVGRRRSVRRLQWFSSVILDPLSAESIAVNFARDRGYPPHLKPPDALPDKHQFDPDKLG